MMPHLHVTLLQAGEIVLELLHLDFTAGQRLYLALGCNATDKRHFLRFGQTCTPYVSTLRQVCVKAVRWSTMRCKTAAYFCWFVSFEIIW